MLSHNGECPAITDRLTLPVRVPTRSIPENTSVISTAPSPTDPCLNDVGTHCSAELQAVGANFWPITYTHIAATKYFVMSDNIASTSISYNSEKFTIPEADQLYYSQYGIFTGTVDDLTISAIGNIHALVGLNLFLVSCGIELTANRLGLLTI